MSTVHVEVSGMPCRRVAPTASASIVTCWTDFPRDLAHTNHIFSAPCMSSTRSKMSIAPFGAWSGTGRAPANRNIRSIATAPHPPRGAQRILYKSFFRPRVSIAPQYIHFSVSGPRIRHNVFLLKTWIAKLPTQYLRHAKLSIVAPCLNACLADTALDQRAVVWPACLGPWHASLQRTRSMDHHSGQCAGLPRSFPWPVDLALHARWPRTPAPTDTVSASRAAQVVVCVYRDATVSAAARLGKHLFPAGHRWPTWPPYQNGHKLLPAMYSK